MQSKHLIRRTSLAAAMALAFGLATPALAQTILKFSHTDQQQGARQAAAQVFAKKVEDYTQGRYKVQVFCCSQLGNDPKNVEQLALGGIDFTVTSTGTYAAQIPSLNVMMMPFILDTYAQGWKFYDESKWLKAQFDKAPSKGFRILATWEAGFRNMTTRDVLNGPEDVNFKRRADLICPTLIHHNDPIRDGQRFFLIVCHKDGCNAEPLLDGTNFGTQRYTDLCIQG